MQPVPDLIDTTVAQAAIRFTQSTESPSVFNHSVRSYLFGELVAVREGMRPDADYDSEACADKPNKPHRPKRLNSSIRK
jgi:hypothetical protein